VKLKPELLMSIVQPEPVSTFRLSRHRVNAFISLLAFVSHRICNDYKLIGL
jgi:hypothetical protein